MLNSLKAGFPPEKLDISVEGSFGGTITSFDYTNRMRQAVFAPCPYGNNEETHRFSEAVYMGCIPVVLDAKFLHKTYARLQALIASTWPETVTLMQEAMKNMTALEERQLELQAWQDRLFECWQADMQLILNKAVVQR
jgi:hypothetical protein